MDFSTKRRSVKDQRKVQSLWWSGRRETLLYNKAQRCKTYPPPTRLHTHTHLHPAHQWRWNQYLQLVSAILNSCCRPRVHLQCNLLPLCAGEWLGFLSLCCCRWWLCVCRLKRTTVSEQFLICRPRHTFLWDQTLPEEKLCGVLLENTSCTQLSPNYTAKHIQCDSFYGLRGNQA